MHVAARWAPMSRPPRIPGFNYVGLFRYSLTICTRNRQPVFLETPIIASTLWHFRRTGIEEPFDMIAYCFMTDHVHLLIEGTSATSDFKRYVKLGKQRSGAAFAALKHRPLWQEGYFDRVLRADDDVKPLARYILNNPVRARLVESPGDYPHIGSDRYTLAELFESVV